MLSSEQEAISNNVSRFMVFNLHRILNMFWLLVEVNNTPLDGKANPITFT